MLRAAVATRMKMLGLLNSAFKIPQRHVLFMEDFVKLQFLRKLNAGYKADSLFQWVSSAGWGEVSGVSLSCAHHIPRIWISFAPCRGESLFSPALHPELFFCQGTLGSCAGLCNSPLGTPADTAAPCRAGQQHTAGQRGHPPGICKAVLLQWGAGSDPRSAGVSFWAISGNDQWDQGVLFNCKWI